MTFPAGSPTLAQTGPNGSTTDAISWPSSSGATEYYATTSATFATSAATLEAWVYLTALPTAQTGIVCCSSSYGGGGADKYMYVGTDGKVRLYLFNSGQLTVASSNALSLNTWHHVVASVGAAGTKIRTDKVTDGTNANTGSSGGSYKVFIHGGGADGTGGNAVNVTDSSAVKIAEVAVWQSQLSDAQTDAHFDAMAPPSSAAGTASLSLSASGAAKTPAAGAAALALSATGTLGQLASGTAGLSLTASGAARAVGTGSASLTLSGSGSAQLGASGAAFLTLGSTGQANPLYLSDTANSFGGLALGGTATVTVTYSFATSDAPPTVRVDKAVALPHPTLVKGRPT